MQLHKSTVIFALHDVLVGYDGEREGDWRRWALGMELRDIAPR